MEHILDEQFTSYIYTDKADTEITKLISKELSAVEFIVRDEKNWNIRYITGIIMDPNIKVLVIHNIDDLSIAEITLASFMCKQILCITNTIKDYPKLFEMITDLQPGCNLTINNNSFSHWYDSTIRK